MHAAVARAREAVDVALLEAGVVERTPERLRLEHTPLRSGVTGPSDNPTPTMHTRLCTDRLGGTYLTPCQAACRARKLDAMRMDDMILVSVDDHVVEPPDLFEHHLPAKYKDIAPRIEHTPDGTDVWKFLDFDIPNVGLNAVAGRPPEEYGMDPTSFDELRPGTYDVQRARARHVGQRPARLAQLPVAARLRRPAVRRARRQGRRARARASAYNDWHIDEWCGAAPDRFIPLAIPPIWDPEALADEVRRVAKKGCHAITFPENPVPLGLPSLHTDHWDPFWQACSDEGTIVNMHIGSSGQARDHRARRARST